LYPCIKRDLAILCVDFNDATSSALYGAATLETATTLTCCVAGAAFNRPDWIGAGFISCVGSMLTVCGAYGTNFVAKTISIPPARRQRTKLSPLVPKSQGPSRPAVLSMEGARVLTHSQRAAAPSDTPQLTELSPLVPKSQGPLRPPFSIPPLNLAFLSAQQDFHHTVSQLASLPPAPDTDSISSNTDSTSTSTTQSASDKPQASPKILANAIDAATASTLDLTSENYDIILAPNTRTIPNSRLVREYWRKDP